ncbi:MAG: carbon-nitrogen hydrolase family protein [Burkholderiaceae bacterium]|nr:MAG: carbon-nitrogen hydrolase family protein [Burkholderiaceae bacterium]TAM08909.1 MAG: carbon-nitrogen hydrolase family protein [Pusillimonas sp.]
MTGKVPTQGPNINKTGVFTVGDKYPKIKVAAVHAATEFLNRDASIDKACALIAEAGSKGAQLIAFPEAFIPGYPFWVWSHTPVQAKALFAELFANSVELPSEASARIGEAARKANAWVAMGINEREGGTLYNTLAYFDNEGRFVARHRKLQPTNAERTVWGRGDGSDVFVLDTPIGRVGGLICYEHTMDLNRYALAALGEQIHIAVWPAASANYTSANADNFDNITETAVKYQAMAAQAFVICVQGRVNESILNKLGFADQPEKMRLGGGLSGIVGPDAKWIAGPHRDDEAIIYADIDLGIIRYAKFFADSAGHYARPDVFSFDVNQGAQTPLASASGGILPAGLLRKAEQPSEGAKDNNDVAGKVVRPPVSR